MTKNKQLSINMIAQIITFIVNIGISFFLTPYIVKHVGEEAYGFVGLANNFISYATIITTALNSMAGRFITISIHREEYKDTNEYFTSLIAANICISIILSIASVFILMFLDKIVNISGNIIGDVRLLWSFLFINFIIGLICNVFNVATFAKNRLELSSMRNIESNIIKALILLSAFGLFEPHIWYLGLSTLICGLYVIATNIYYTKKFLPFVNINKIYINLKKIKTLILSGMWNSLTKISSILSTGLDLLITNLFVGTAAMGTVSIAKTLPTYILSVFAMLASVFAPQLTISYAKNDMNDIKKQLIFSIKLLGFFACIPMAFLYAYGSEFFKLWMPELNSELMHTLSILASAAFVFAIPMEPLWNVFTVTNKVKQSSLFLLSNAVISVAAVFIMLKYTTDETMKMYIIIGTSTVLSVIRGITFLPAYGAVCLDFKWYTFYPVILKNIVSVTIVTLIAFMIKIILPINSWGILFADIALMSVTSCVINYFIMLDKGERKLLNHKLFKRL